MENEIRYYLKQIKSLMAEPVEGEERIPFKPTYLVQATKLPTGAIELTVNTDNIESKIDYILEAYDADMCLKTNRSVCIQNIMIVQEDLPMDKETVVCKECGALFVVTADEKHWLEERGLKPPKRCKDCRKKRRENSNNAK